MLDEIHGLMTALHILAGAVALVVFWQAALSRKGGAGHRRGGRRFERSMYVVTTTGIAASLLVLIDPLAVRDPLGSLQEGPGGAAAAAAQGFRHGALFLLTISVLVLAAVRTGVLALRTGKRPHAMRHPLHLALLAAQTALGLVTLAVGLLEGPVLLIVFGLFAALSGPRRLVTALRGVAPADRVRVHLVGMFTGAIGAYTAFFVFGGQRLFADWLQGQWMLVPWLAPGILGGLAVAWYSRRLRRAGAGVIAGQPVRV